MDKIPGINIKSARFLFAIAMIAMGIEHFIFGDFIAGRAPAWPQGIPGRLVWAYLSGVTLILAGITILLEKRARMTVMLAAAIIFVWSGLRNLPGLIMHPQSGLDWANTGKSLAISGGAFIVAATFPPEEPPVRRLRWFQQQADRLARLGGYFIGLFMILCGIEHFIYVQFVATLVPAWIPGHTFWARFAGVALIAGGLGLVLRIQARLAAGLAGIMIFIWTIVLHLPRAIAAPLQGNGNELTALQEALAFSGALFILYIVIGQRSALKERQILAAN